MTTPAGEYDYSCRRVRLLPQESMTTPAGEYTTPAGEYHYSRRRAQNHHQLNVQSATTTETHFPVDDLNQFQQNRLMKIGNKIVPQF